MGMTREEAARALGEVEQAERRSFVLARYAGGGPVLIVWGLEWLACNLVTQFAPEWAGWAWLAGTVLAIGASVWLGRGEGGAARRGWRALAAGGVILGWMACVFTVARVSDFRASDALISLTAAAAYVMLGVWSGARWAVLGLGLAALILAGWFLAGGWFFAWMGVAAGGSLILSGLWLRRA